MKIKKYLYSIFTRKNRFNSKNYWQNRYSTNGNSGPGSYGKLAKWKAIIINDFVEEKKINTVIELGCGDGNQLKLANYSKYTGYDVSDFAVQKCKTIFKNDYSKFFANISELKPKVTNADLSLSLDVIFHIIEDDIYYEYMKTLFQISTRYVIIYSSNYEGFIDQHVRCRRFTDWILKNMSNQFQQIAFIPNIYPFEIDKPNETSMCDFYIYERIYKRHK